MLQIHKVAKLSDAMNAVNYFPSRYDRQQIVFLFHISFAFWSHVHTQFNMENTFYMK